MSRKNFAIEEEKNLIERELEEAKILIAGLKNQAAEDEIKFSAEIENLQILYELHKRRWDEQVDSKFYNLHY